MRQTGMLPFSDAVSISSSNATKLKIVKAVDKPLDEINIGNLSKKCGISRQTFYHHFNSKYDIPFWYAQFCQSFYLDRIGREYTWLEGFSNHFDLLYNEKEFLSLSVKRKTSFGQDKRRMEADRKETILETLVDYRGVKLDDDLIFEVDLFTLFETEVAYRWFLDDMRTSPKVLARRMDSVVPRRLHGLMDVYKALP